MYSNMTRHTFSIQIRGEYKTVTQNGVRLLRRRGEEAPGVDKQREEQFDQRAEGLRVETGQRVPGLEFDQFDRSYS